MDEEKGGLGLDLQHVFRLTTPGRKSILNMAYKKRERDIEWKQQTIRGVLRVGLVPSKFKP